MDTKTQEWYKNCASLKQLAVYAERLTTALYTSVGLHSGKDTTDQLYVELQFIHEQIKNRINDVK